MFINEINATMRNVAKQLQCHMLHSKTICIIGRRKGKRDVRRASRKDKSEMKSKYVEAGVMLEGFIKNIKLITKGFKPGASSS